MKKEKINKLKKELYLFLSKKIVLSTIDYDKNVITFLNCKVEYHRTIKTIENEINEFYFKNGLNYLDNVEIVYYINNTFNDEGNKQFSNITLSILDSENFND